MSLNIPLAHFIETFILQFTAMAGFRLSGLQGQDWCCGLEETKFVKSYPNLNPSSPSSIPDVTSRAASSGGLRQAGVLGE